jgi:hypothetical protein
MQQSRRVFLRALGAGVAVVSLPEISSIFNLFPSSSATDDDLAAMLQKLFTGEDTAGGGPFVAHAETAFIESSPQQLLNSPSALMNILDQMGVKKSFSTSVDYSEASQCRKHFERQEETWRNSQSLGTGAIYTDVQRAHADPNVAILVGGKVNPASSRLHHAEGSVQYQQKPAIRMAGDDAGVVSRTSSVIGEHFTLSDKDLAQTLALVENKRIKMDDGQLAHRYETPLNSIVYVGRPRLNNRVGSRAVGVIAVRNKQAHRNPNNIYFADAYK